MEIYLFIYVVIYSFFLKNNTREQENFRDQKLNYTLTVFTIKVISISLLVVTITIEM